MKIQVIKFPFFLVDVLNFLHNFFFFFLVNAQNVLKKKIKKVTGRVNLFLPEESHRRKTLDGAAGKRPLKVGRFLPWLCSELGDC